MKGTCKFYEMWNVTSLVGLIMYSSCMCMYTCILVIYNLYLFDWRAALWQQRMFKVLFIPTDFIDQYIGLALYYVGLQISDGNKHQNKINRLEGVCTFFHRVTGEEEEA